QVRGACAALRGRGLRRRRALHAFHDREILRAIEAAPAGRTETLTTQPLAAVRQRARVRQVVAAIARDLFERDETGCRHALTCSEKRSEAVERSALAMRASSSAVGSARSFSMRQ